MQEDQEKEAQRRNRYHCQRERLMPNDQIADLEKFIEGFAASDVRSYPAPKLELKDENGGMALKLSPHGEGTVVKLLEEHIQRALRWHGQEERAALEARRISTRLLDSSDPRLACAVGSLPFTEITVGRLLGHVEALGLGLEPALTATIARRAWLVLMNNRSAL